MVARGGKWVGEGINVSVGEGGVEVGRVAEAVGGGLGVGMVGDTACAVQPEKKIARTRIGIIFIGSVVPPFFVAFRKIEATPIFVDKRF